VSIAERVSEALGGNKTGKQWVCRCPAHDDETPSLSVWNKPDGKLGLKCYAGCKTGEVLTALADRGLIEPEVAGLAAPKDPDSDEAKIEKAKQTWTKTVKLDGTPGEKYLNKRGITTWFSGSVRYLKHARKLDDGSWQGAVVFKFVSQAEQVEAVQLVYVDADGNKSQIDPQKRSQGVPRGTACIFYGEGPQVVVEGPEDGCSIWQVSQRHTIIVGGIDLLMDLPLAEGTQLVIGRDPDKPGSPAFKRLVETTRKLQARGVEVLIATPPQLEGRKKTDWNDLLVNGQIDMIRSSLLEATGAGDILAIDPNGQDEDKIPQGSPPWDDGPPAGGGGGGGGTGPTLPPGPMSPADGLRYMNGKYAVVKEGGKTLVAAKKYDSVLERESIEFQSLTSFKEFYCNRYVTTGMRNRQPVTEPLGDFWVKHPMRKQFEQVVFKPEAETPGSLNLWRGWGLEDKPGDWSMMQEHLYDNVCKKSKADYDYLLRWMAKMVQQPGSPAEVAIVTIGKRGTGKSIVAKALGKIFGAHHMAVSNARHVVGNFNYHLRDVVFLFLDEAFWAGDKQHESVLKTLITEPFLVVEGKGKDAITAPNVLHIMMASNSDWVVPAGLEERRFAVFEVADTRMQDTQFFGQMSAQMKAGGYSAMFHDLKHLPLDGFEIRTIPKNQSLLDQKIHSLGREQAWWFQKLVFGKILASDENWPELVACEWMYDDYCKTLDKARVNRKSLEVEFSMKMKKLFPREEFQRESAVLNITRTNQFGESVPDRLRTYAYRVPPLEECRRWFEGVLQQPVDWGAYLKKQGTLPMKDGVPF
jgi:hypothetical protein